MQISEINMDELVEVYVSIREAKNAARRTWQKEDDELSEKLALLRAVMLQHMNLTGAKNIGTVHGTVYREEVLKPSAADWGAIWRWAKENDALGIFEKRLTAKFIKDYMEEHQGAVPPGVNVHREYDVKVRKANTPSSGPEEEDNGN